MTVKVTSIPKRPIEYLASAIVFQAIADYQEALKRVMQEQADYHEALKRVTQEREYMKKDIAEMAEIEEFLRSDYCYALCGVDGDVIMNHISEIEVPSDYAMGVREV